MNSRSVSRRLSVSVPFDVVSRSKTERVNKGNRETIYRVTLKSHDGRHRLTLSDTDAALIQKYPLFSTVSVRIGQNSQATLAEKEA